MTTVGMEQRSEEVDLSERKPQGFERWREGGLNTEVKICRLKDISRQGNTSQ